MDLNIDNFAWTGHDNYKKDTNHGYQLCRQMTLAETFYWRAYSPDPKLIATGSLGECILACQKHLGVE